MSFESDEELALAVDDLMLLKRDIQRAHAMCGVPSDVSARIVARVSRVAFRVQGARASAGPPPRSTRAVTERNDRDANVSISRITRRLGEN
jgi:hypothetical protein